MKEFAATKRKVHSLKGSSANIGANHLAEIYAAFEMNAESFSRDEFVTRFAQIEAGVFLKTFVAIEAVQRFETETLAKT